MKFQIQPNQVDRPAGWAKCWIPENEPAFLEFEKALDEFSRSTTGMSWSQALRAPSPSQPWNDEESALFAVALQQAPKALMTAPYSTVVKLFQMRDMAADHNKLEKGFWESLRNACDDLAAEQHS